MRLRNRIILCSLIFIPTLFAFPQSSSSILAQRIEQIMARPEFRHALFGIKFYSLDTGKTLYELNADKLFKPASTTKLLTIGTALQTLGANYHFHTRVYRTGPIKNGKLEGDLVLVASGDPNLSGRIQPDGTLAFTNEDHSYDGDPNTQAVAGDPLLVIHELADEIAKQIPKEIKGRVLIDASLFPEGERELGTGIVISPIVVNDNIIDVTLTPGTTAGAATSMQASPVTGYAKFINQVKTGAPDSKPNVDIASDTVSDDGEHTVTFSGTTPAGKPILYAYPVPEPARFTAVVLTEALEQRGVKVTKKAPESKSNKIDFAALAQKYTPENVVAEHVSPPLSEEAKVTLKVSQNLHASMWPYLLGALVRHAKSDIAQAGFDVEQEFLSKAGLDLSGASQSDGAGGAEGGAYTPNFMVDYLKYMATQKDYPVFLNALPVLGKDGTLWNIQPASPAAGHVFAKTGTFGSSDALNRNTLLTAKGLAGYMTTAAGEHLIFALYVNRVPLSRAPNESTRVAGQALGEIAASAYDLPRSQSVASGEQ
jgi:D-alanyl-D-alanine carboxypeptidase/D-alanyl-D-alanine-endopeptidase (penicillin-binding protein 4)